MENQILEFNDKVKAILVAHGLDFTIHKAPMVAIMGGGDEKKEVGSAYFGLINSSTMEVISTVKEGYGVSQNADIVGMVLKSIEAFGDKLIVSKAGSLNGGRKVFMQLAVAGESIVGEDTIKRFITIIDSNDKSCSLSVGVSDVTMSCSNQFARFYERGDKIRHSASLEQKLRELPETIAAALNKSLKQIELYQQLTTVPVEYDLVHRIVKHVLGFDKVYTSTEAMSKKTVKSIEKMETLYSHIDKEMLQKGFNLWGLHSGVTSYTTHELKKPNRANGDYESLLMGTAYTMNQKSLRFVTEKLNATVQQ